MVSLSLASWLKRALSAARLSPLIGYVDRQSTDELGGWAHDPDRPNRRVRVVALEGGRVVVEALADQMRKDLQIAGIGDGGHAFYLKLPDGVSPDRIVLQARLDGKRKTLTRAKGLSGLSPATRAVGHPPPSKSAAPTRVSGGLIQLSCNRLVGWAINTSPPNAPIEIDIYYGERFLGCALADGPAPSGTLPEATSFEFTIADIDLVEDVSRLRARPKGSQMDLVFAPVFLEGIQGTESKTTIAGPSPPPEITLAFWGTWAPHPPALYGLLRLARTWDVEVLVPASTSAEPIRALEQAAAAAPGVVRLKRVDCSAQQSRTAQLRILTHAATAPVVLVAHASITGIDPEVIAADATRLLEPKVGSVVFPAQTPSGGRAAPAALMALSRRMIAVEEAFADLDDSASDAALLKKGGQNGWSNLISAARAVNCAEVAGYAVGDAERTP